MLNRYQTFPRLENIQVEVYVFCKMYISHHSCTHICRQVERWETKEM